MGSKPEPFTVIVDSREQKPYRFERMAVAALPAGDYSIQGLEGEVAIERKSRQDAYASLGAGRARFERELARLSRLKYAAIVVESTLPGFLTPPPFTTMNPKAAVNSLIAWSVKYRVCVFFAGDRVHAQALTRRLLEKYWKYRTEKPRAH